MPFFVYILQSVPHGRYYIGQTSSIEGRLARHNAGTEKATKAYLPWTMLWHCEKASRAEAMELERKLKNLSRLRLENFMEKHETDLDDPTAKSTGPDAA